VKRRVRSAARVRKIGEGKSVITDASSFRLEGDALLSLEGERKEYVQNSRSSLFIILYFFGGE
jgi:hypothetical protein